MGRAGKMGEGKKNGQPAKSGKMSQTDLAKTWTKNHEGGGGKTLGMLIFASNRRGTTRL